MFYAIGLSRDIMELSQCIFWYNSKDLQYEQDGDRQNRRAFLTNAVNTIFGLHHLEIKSESPYYLVSGNSDELLEIYPINGEISDVYTDEKRELRYLYDEYPLRMLNYRSSESERKYYKFQIEQTSKRKIPPMRYLEIYTKPNKKFTGLFPEPKIGDELDAMSDKKRIKLVELLKHIGYFGW
jgi:hypothetical protein